MTTRKIDFPSEELMPLGDEVETQNSENGHHVPATKAEALNSSAYQQLVTRLQEPLNPSLIKKRKGYDGKMLDYIEWHTTVQQLNRLFGYGNWSTDVKDITDLPPGEDGIPNGVRATVTLTVDFPARAMASQYGPTTIFTNVGFGAVRRSRSTGKASDEAYGMALKGAVHDALKRCATALGEQFGLGLYFDDDVTPDEADTETTDNPAPRTSTPTPLRPSQQRGARQSYECTNCGNEVKGYTSREGKFVSADDLSKMRKGDFCWDCYSANRG